MVDSFDPSRDGCNSWREIMLWQWKRGGNHTSRNKEGSHKKEKTLVVKMIVTPEGEKGGGGRVGGVVLHLTQLWSSGEQLVHLWSDIYGCQPCSCNRHLSVRDGSAGEYVTQHEKWMNEWENKNGIVSRFHATCEGLNAGPVLIDQCQERETICLQWHTQVLLAGWTVICSSVVVDSSCSVYAEATGGLKPNPLSCFFGYKTIMCFALFTLKENGISYPLICSRL